MRGILIICASMIGCNTVGGNFGIGAEHRIVGDFDKYDCSLPIESEEFKKNVVIHKYCEGDELEEEYEVPIGDAIDNDEGCYFVVDYVTTQTQVIRAKMDCIPDSLKGYTP